MEQWFHPMGLNLCVATGCESLANAVCDAYGAFGPGNAAQPSDLRFEFGLKERNGGAADFTYELSSARASLQAGDAAQLVVDLTTGAARGDFSEPVIADRESFRLHVLHFALSAAIGGRGFLGLHAACIARSGRGILLRGASGAGKTVLAYAAASREFDMIGGSTTWVAPDEQTWWGMPGRTYLRPSARALFPELGQAPSVRIDGTAKLAVTVKATVQRTRPAIIIHLERGEEGESRMWPIGESEAAVLWDRGHAGAERNQPLYRERVARLLAHPNYRMRAGANLDDAFNAIAGALC